MLGEYPTILATDKTALPDKLGHEKAIALLPARGISIVAQKSLHTGKNFFDGFCRHLKRATQDQKERSSDCLNLKTAFR